MSGTDLTAERLRELLHYDPETGVFTRKVQTSKRIRVGQVAGTLNGSGRLYIRVHGIKQQAHRLAWLYVYGVWPDGEIDHINGDPIDNRISNLRVVDRTGNTQNTHRLVNRNGMPTGVRWNRGGWGVRIQVNKKRVFLGNFRTIEEAQAAYLEAKRTLHPTFSL